MKHLWELTVYKKKQKGPPPFHTYFLTQIFLLSDDGKNTLQNNLRANIYFLTLSFFNSEKSRDYIFHLTVNIE